MGTEMLLFTSLLPYFFKSHLNTRWSKQARDKLDKACSQAITPRHQHEQWSDDMRPRGVISPWDNVNDNALSSYL